ncbi:DMT family transporter [uncultured Algimonas sp.]|uniref:DMT family transporter n=1 Tax=uncultured Algimonas sp. TaxID=1547920 RepID=UPI00260554D1|nr:DMT family transporter [uncultured Algimonas sp.]
MTGRDFILLMLCCLGWGGNFVVSAWVVGSNPVPPFMLALFRAGFVLLFMGVFLFRPLPKGFGRLLIVSLCVGPIHLGLLYTGLQTAPASAGSIISQSLIPMSTMLSVLFLKERIGWVRSSAIGVSFVGVMIMVYEPGALSLDYGLIVLLVAYVSLAIGSVLMRTVPDVDWRQYVAWTALLLFVLSFAATSLFETGHHEVWDVAGWKLVAVALYAALFVSIFAHGQYFRLLQTYEVNQVIPLTLITTLWACLLGVMLLNETLYPRYLIGAALILPCVWIIARRGAVPPVQED